METYLKVSSLNYKIPYFRLFLIFSVVVSVMFVTPIVFAITNCGDVINSSLTLTNNVTSCNNGDGIILNASNIILDCDGKSIHSNTHSNNGILLGELADNVTIKNCEIMNFNNGIADEVKEAEPCPNKNHSNIIIQDMFFNNNTIGINFVQGDCVGITPFFRNLTLTNINFTPLNYGMSGEIDICNFNNLQFSCNLSLGGTCETTAIFDDLRDCNINNWITTTSFHLGIYIGQNTLPRSERIVFNNVFLNVTNGSKFSSSIGNFPTFPIGFFPDLSVNMTIDNSTIVTDNENNLTAIFGEFGVFDIKVTDTSYPYGKETIFDGNLLRYWRVNVTTNVDNVDITATSQLNEKVSGATDNNGLLTLLLLEYSHGSATITNSTPYTVEAVKGKQVFQGVLSIGNSLINTLTFDVTLPTINLINDTPDPLSAVNLLNITANVTDDIFVKTVLVEINRTNYSMARVVANNTLFLDDFESRNLSINGWVVSGAGAAWTNSSASPFSGASHLRAEPRNLGGSFIETNISTLGYKDIDFSFYAATTGLDAGDTFKVEWHNGSGWTNLLTTHDSTADEFSGISGYRFFGFSLPESADNKNSISIRFVCIAGGVSEVCDVDNVTITRSIQPQKAFFDDFESKNLSNWTTSGAGAAWTNSSASPFSGASHLRAEPRNLGGSFIETNISTLGYKDIDFSFYAATTGLDAGDTFKVEWHNGSGWTNLLTTHDSTADEFSGISGYRFFGFSLPESADNKNSISIRFVCIAGGVNEICDVDNATVTKIPFEDLWSILFNATGLSIGTHSYNVYASDLHGKNATPKKSNFTLSEGDTDNDGIANSIDNCQTTFNPDQLDSDSDSAGDVCDACPADATNTCDSAESSSTTIDETGGIINTSSGKAEVNIPANALANDTSISISGSNATPTTNVSSFMIQTNNTNASLIYSFTPEGINFSAPVTITLKYDDTGLDESTVDIYFFNATTQLWVPQNATCDIVLNECSLNVTHFSDFIVGGLSDTDGDGLNDFEDACPSTAGKFEYQGCPVGDNNLVELHVIDKAKTFCGGAGSCKVPIENANVRVFDRNNESFKANFTKNPSHALYQEVYEADIGRIANCTTNSTGECIAVEERIGDYLVIVKFTDTETGKTIYTGKPKSPDDFVDTDEDGIVDLASKYFQIIKVINKDGVIDFKLN